MKATFPFLFTAAAFHAKGALNPPRELDHISAHNPDQMPDGFASANWSSLQATFEVGRHDLRAVKGEAGIFEGNTPCQEIGGLWS